MKRYRREKRKKLKPAGHSAVIESLIQPAIVVGSTLMSAIAAYVLGLDEITRILDGRWQPSDWFIVILCAGMGFLIDMAIIVSATRYKMHAVRDDPREDAWLTLAKWVLGIGLCSEAMTLFYFFVYLDPGAFPPFLIWLANGIHAVLAVSRAFLPPIVIAYFAAGVLPVMFDRADRNREIKSRTSSNAMVLIDRLSEVDDTNDKGEMLRALGGQLMLATYAEYDETGRTSEDQQLRRDAKLLEHLARIHHLDWSSIAADVAPELATLPAPALPQPAQQAVTPPLPQMYLPRFEATAGLPAATQEAAQTASPVESDHLDLSAEAIMERVRRELHLPADASFDEPPPDDGGAPTFASKRIAQESDNVTPLRRGMGRASAAPRRDRRVVNRANARAGKRGSAEYRVRHVVASKPEADLDEVARQAKVSPSTASKWLEVIAAENRVRTHREAQ